MGISYFESRSMLARALALALVPAAVLFGLAAAPASAGAGATASAKAPTAGIEFVTRTQAALGSGRAVIRVSVKDPRRGDHNSRARRVPSRVQVMLQARQAWSKWTNAGKATVVLRPGRTVTARIRLGRAALSLVRNCGRPQLRLTAVTRTGGRAVRSKAASGRLKLNRSQCSIPAEVDLTQAGRCDFIAAYGNPCLAPFPNDFYSRIDRTSETGRRLDLKPGSTPANNAGTNIDVADFNLSDGFSTGPLISVHVPGMDNQVAFDRSGVVSLGQMGRSYEPSQPVLLIDARTGERQLIWAELDSNATADASRNLIIRPGRNLTNGRRYIVALRNLKNADGKAIAAPPGFRLYRDNRRTLNRTVEKQRNRYESIFRTLSKEGVSRRSLYLAWDFTVASTENITGRMLSIRDRAFAELGDTNLADKVVQGDSPDFQITNVIDYPSASGNGVENIRTVDGTFTVPCYLDRDGCPSGSRFNLDANQTPIRIPGNEMTARFTCNIPRSSVDGAGDVVEKARPSLYGHGLFGQFSETNTRNVRALGTENGVMTCGTDWSGMAAEDVFFSAIPALQELSSFSTLPDRLQQGFLNFLFLGRLMIHPDGFSNDAAFRFNGESVIDTSDLFYYGNSQGGIAGGALTAVSPDFTRSVLYVPGMNYSTLLTRAAPFDTYSKILYPAYRREVERPVIFSLMQTLWDRGEPNGYANHMTDNPLPNTPAHKVLIEMAYGDHQVANVATEVQARTIGAPLRAPALDSNRLPAGLIQPYFGHETLGDLAGPAGNGSGFFIWDIGPKRLVGQTEFGTDPPPIGNIPPPGDAGVDPHDTVINQSPLIRKQIADFLTTGGRITNPCGADPCYAAGWNGFP
jgi:hypothetical protein